ncbi:MAG: hypothetical protein ABI824_03330 [Acidobacteriota bacterium]
MAGYVSHEPAAGFDSAFQGFRAASLLPVSSRRFCSTIFLSSPASRSVEYGDDQAFLQSLDKGPTELDLEIMP